MNTITIVLIGLCNIQLRFYLWYTVDNQRKNLRSMHVSRSFIVVLQRNNNFDTIPFIYKRWCHHTRKEEEELDKVTGVITNKNAQKCLFANNSRFYFFYHLFFNVESCKILCAIIMCSVRNMHNELGYILSQTYFSLLY